MGERFFIMLIVGLIGGLAFHYCNINSRTVSTKTSTPVAVTNTSSKPTYSIDKERAYFEGQLTACKAMSSHQEGTLRAFQEGFQDAMNGSIRIMFDTTSGNYTWIKSPWDDGTPPLYQPGNGLPEK